MNLVPIFGALFWGWTPFSVLFAYWLESLGNVGTTGVKIFLSKGDGNKSFNLSKSIWFMLKHAAILLFYLVFIVTFTGIVLDHLIDRESSALQYLLFFDHSFRYTMILFLLIKVAVTNQ